MVYVYLWGRLGNNLFQLNAAAYLATRLTTEFFAVPWPQYWCPEPDNCWLEDYLAPYKKTIFKKIKFIGVNEIPQNIIQLNEGTDLDSHLDRNKNYILHGLFSNTSYLKTNIIRSFFEIDSNIQEQIRSRHDILNNPDEVAAVIVRRGDYMQRLHEYNVCGSLYYKTAMKKLKKSGINKFLIISDDIYWCKKYLNGTGVSYVKDTTPLTDLYAGAMCRSQIISNSTFALWSAYLCQYENNTVIYPTPWFGRALWKSQENLIKNALPSNWKKSRNISVYTFIGYGYFLVKGIKKKIQFLKNK